MAVHNDYGERGEQIAADFLSSNGYFVRQTHWRAGHKELDIVAEKDGTLVVVEVKARHNGDYCRPVDVLTNAKIRRIVMAADAYVRFNRLDMPVRFDLITITGSPDQPKITHYEQAFTSPVWYR